MEIPESWTFKKDDVAKDFDQHVREQLPWYDVVTELVTIVAKHYLPEGALAYDIGASTGNIGVALEKEIIDRKITWIGIDNSESMRDVYKAKGKLEICDAIDYQFKPFNLAVCFLSIMFFQVDKRVNWMHELVRACKPGGAIIVVDKEVSSGGKLSTALHRATLLCKKKHGATAENILSKEISLCGIQNPIPKNFFDNLDAVEIFRFGDFAAWIIEKKEFGYR